MQVKAIPPQLFDDWASKLIKEAVDQQAVSKLSVAVVVSNIIIQPMKQEGALSLIVQMVTSVQLIAHIPLLNV